MMEPTEEQYREWSMKAQWGTDLARMAYQAGADEQLRLCVEWLNDIHCDDPQETAARMQAAMRPKPPSLKQQALEAFQPIGFTADGGRFVSREQAETILRAIESLPDE
jgi:hypothetical protein